MPIGVLSSYNQLFFLLNKVNLLAFALMVTRLAWGGR